MDNLDKINEAINNIEIAEKTRVLYQLLVENLKLDPKQCTFKEVIDTLKYFMNKESEAIKIMADTQRNIIKEPYKPDKKPTEEETAVS